eukprot:scaffold36343_cov4245-Amphora_coffeaeformis.AAC.8
MSRIGKLPITIPDSVDVNYTDSKITVKGKFGTLENQIPESIVVTEDNGQLSVQVKEQKKDSRAMHGVGYRAVVQGKEIILNLGYSHPVKIEIPSDINVEVVQNTTINLKSCDKEALGLFAANIRSWRLPEPYKGKGILYKNEQILRKAGKSGK